LDRCPVWIQFTEDRRKWVDDRAAILEYEVGMPRHMAEAQSRTWLQSGVAAVKGHDGWPRHPIS